MLLISNKGLPLFAKMQTTQSQRYTLFLKRKKESIKKMKKSAANEINLLTN